jgi:hypothetical protein
MNKNTIPTGRFARPGLFVGLSRGQPAPSFAGLAWRRVSFPLLSAVLKFTLGDGPAIVAAGDTLGTPGRWFGRPGPDAISAVACGAIVSGDRGNTITDNGRRPAPTK